MALDNRTNIFFRYGLVVGLILLVSGWVMRYLVHTTVIDAEAWNHKADTELSRSYPILPERGNILAADGSILAANLRFYTVRIDFRSERFNSKLYLDTIETICDSLAARFPRRTKEQWKTYLLQPMTKLKEERPRAFPVITNINYAQLQWLRTLPFFNIKNPNRNGLVVEDYLKRVNPYGNMARRSIGGVGETSECAEVHGISGLEKALDSLLYGIPGTARKVALTRDMVPWTEVPAVPGYDIVTTIDINLQDVVENELNSMLEYCDADWGVAVLMDVATGDIKAISNLEKNDRGAGYIEGMNRAVLGYEPGSVVKTLSMMVALEDGIVSSPNEVIATGSGWAYAGGNRITDSHGVNSLTVAEVIERSSNIGMAKIITRKYDSHPGGFYSRVKQMGFLEPMNTGIAGESTPRFDSVPTDRGGRIALSRMCYGYATEIPPLYTLSIYNAIANGGRYVRPRLVQRLIGADRDSVLPVTYIRDRVCSEQNAELLRKMLTRVVWGDHGTARRLRNDNVRIAGKTGTCYMIEDRHYNKSKKRLAFCGFFPAENPKYSAIVLISSPRRNAMGAPSTSGEVVKGIAMKLYSRGLLDNSSDFHEGKKAAGGEPDKVPTYHASAVNPDRAKQLHSSLAIGGSHRSYRAPSGTTAPGTVPSVRGLSVREAVARLENAGYNVELHGTGSVRSQSPAAGTKASKGAKVVINLN